MQWIEEAAPIPVYSAMAKVRSAGVVFFCRSLNYLNVDAIPTLMPTQCYGDSDVSGGHPAEYSALAGASIR